MLRSPTALLSIYLSIYLHLPSAFSSGRPGRDAHYFFPSRSPDPRSRPPKSFLSRHTLPKKLAVWRFHHVPQDGGRHRGGRRLGRGGLADALPGRGARASAAATKDVEVAGRLELAAWRKVEI